MSPIFRSPASIREIPTVWWDLIMDTSLWKVGMKLLPDEASYETGVHFVRSFRHQAYKRGLRSSTRLVAISGDDTYVYVQAIPPRKDAATFRWPLEQAYPAPAIPQIPVTQVEPTAPHQERNYSDVLQRLQAGREWPPVAPERLIEHPVIGWFAAACTCGTEDVRSHPVFCPCYRALPMFEHQLKRLNVSPEEWVDE